MQDINKIPRDEDKLETPVVNLYGEKLFDSWNALYDSSAHWHVPLYSFDGRNVLEDDTWYPFHKPTYAHVAILGPTSSCGTAQTTTAIECTVRSAQASLATIAASKVESGARRCARTTEWRRLFRTEGL